MSTTYVEAGPEVYELVSSVLAEHFSVIASIDPYPEIEVLMAEGDKGKPAIRSHGHACAGKIKLPKPEERAADQGVPDVRIFLDRNRWDKLSVRRRQALLHHELSHLAIRYDKRSGEVKRDDYGRPRLRLKLDDWMLTGFRDTAELFGEDSLDVQLLRKVGEMLRQQSLPFFGDGSSPAPRAKKSKAKKSKAKKGKESLSVAAQGVPDAEADQSSGTEAA